MNIIVSTMVAFTNVMKYGKYWVLFFSTLPFSVHIYLRQGGYVFAGFCLSVCLFVCLCVTQITQKVMDGSF